MKLFGRVIPIWALIAVVCAGTVAASYLVWSYTYGTTVKEPIVVYTSTSEWTNPGPPANMYAGDFYVGRWLIHNEGNNPLTVTVRISDSKYTRSAITIGLSDEVGSLGPYDTYGSDGTLVTDSNNIETNLVVVKYNEYNEYTFTIGTYDYPKWDGTPESLTEHGLTSYIKLLTGFAVEDDAPAPLDINWTIEVFRG